MPDPESISFNISTNLGARDLTPTNDGAAFSPFVDVDTQTSSDFKLTVFFDDGSSVDTFANEVDSEVVSILYYTPDTACASIDNAANVLTILEGAACAEVEVRVNVTINGKVTLTLTLTLALSLTPNPSPKPNP